MTGLEAALIEVAAALDACGLPYVLIGGLAIAITGEPRATLDVDVSVWAGAGPLDSAVGCLSRHLRPASSEPLRLAQDRRVFPVMAQNGIRADIIFAALAVEVEMISRGVQKKVGEHMIRVATVEDLLLMKLISEREKDLADARALVRRFGKTLDRQYLFPKLEELAEALGRPDILATFRDA